MIDGGREQIRLIDLGPLIAFAGMGMGDQLVQIVVEHPLFQHDGIDSATQQLVYLALLLGNLFIAGILADHGGKVFSQDDFCALKRGDSQVSQLIQGGDGVVVQGKDPVMKGDDRLGQEAAIHHAWFDVDDGIQFAGLEHAKGALQRQKFELKLVSGAGKGLRQQIQFYATLFPFDDIGRNGKTDSDPERFCQQASGGKGDQQQQDMDNQLHRTSYERSCRYINLVGVP